MPRSPRTQDISWFLDLNEKKQIDLDPPYQRRSVWSRKDREFFIDTIMNNLPSPPVFLHKSLDENGKATYHVVDGKQRLQTIINFTLDKVRIPEDFGDQALKKKKWSQLERQQRETFWNYEIVVEMLADVSAPSVKNIFERINRNSRKLVPQELRHAKFDGWFIAFAEAEAEKNEWKVLSVSTPARLKRMADVQFISELLEVSLTGNIGGFDQDRLDSLYAEYEDLEEKPDFVVDDFKTAFEESKTYILLLFQHAPPLNQHWKAQNYLYSLWSYVVLEKARLLPPEQAGPKLLQFFTAVAAATEILKNAGNPPDATDLERGAKLFASNAKGASTELPQRQARHSAIVLAMHGPGAAGNENL